MRRLLAGRTGLEPAASGVTGRRYNQLNYHPVSGGGLHTTANESYNEKVRGVSRRFGLAALGFASLLPRWRPRHDKAEILLV